jgi:hypothetical protein
MIKSALAKFVTGKMAAAALAVSAVGGGVAYAAETGKLPAALGGSEKPAAATSAAAKDHGAKGSPSPSMVGLCHAFTAGAGDNPGKALQNPAFSALITAAGGEDKVADYCATVLVKPTHGAKPTDKPTGKPTDKPAGAKETHGAGAPGGAPTTVPTPHTTR